MSKLKPEAAYFGAEHGLRSAIMFFDMKDASDIPAIAEPLFAGLNGQVLNHPHFYALLLAGGTRLPI